MNVTIVCLACILGGVVLLCLGKGEAMAAVLVTAAATALAKQTHSEKTKRKESEVRETQAIDRVEDLQQELFEKTGTIPEDVVREFRKKSAPPPAAAKR